MDGRNSKVAVWSKYEAVEAMGLEPTTSCLQSRCSSQLSYAPGEWEKKKQEPLAGDSRCLPGERLGQRRLTVAGRRAGYTGWRVVAMVGAGLLIGMAVLAIQLVLQPGKVASGGQL